MIRAGLAVLAILFFAGVARGANQPHPVLDAVATEIAGKPVSVWCETSEAVWDGFLSSAGLHGWDAYGFNYADEPRVYVAPQMCKSLRTILTSGHRAVGPFWASLSIMTVIHEGVHQSGVNDERDTDCRALAALPAIAVKHFGYRETMTESRVKTVMVTARRKVRGAWVTIRVPTQSVVQVEVPDPDFRALLSWAAGWHNTRWAPC